MFAASGSFCRSLSSLFLCLNTGRCNIIFCGLELSLVWYLNWFLSFNHLRYWSWEVLLFIIWHYVPPFSLYFCSGYAYYFLILLHILKWIVTQFVYQLTGSSAVLKSFHISPWYQTLFHFRSYEAQRSWILYWRQHRNTSMCVLPVAWRQFLTETTIVDCLSVSVYVGVCSHEQINYPITDQSGCPSRTRRAAPDPR